MRKLPARISTEDWISRHFPKSGKEVSNVKEGVIEQCVSLTTGSLLPSGADMKFNYLNLSKQIIEPTFLLVINGIVFHKCQCLFGNQ